MRHVLTPRAVQDLQEIGDYIARDDRGAAEKLMVLFAERFAMLARMPGMGRPTPYLGKGARHLPVGSYLVLYRETKTVLQIVRVMHGARQRALESQHDDSNRDT
jgi:toxin ParE1/3/4